MDQAIFRGFPNVCKFWFSVSDGFYQGMTCDVRSQLASCDVRSQLAMCGCEPTLVETCDVRACGVFLGVRCAIAISQLFLLRLLSELHYIFQS